MGPTLVCVSVWTRIVYIEHNIYKYVCVCRCHRRARPFTTASTTDSQYNTCATPVQVSTCVYVCSGGSLPSLCVYPCVCMCAYEKSLDTYSWRLRTPYIYIIRTPFSLSHTSWRRRRCRFNSHNSLEDLRRRHGQ